MTSKLFFGSALAAIAALAACGQSHPPLAPAGAPQASKLGTMPIKHIVIVVQENRSFDNLFYKYPGADYKLTGKTHDGHTIKLTETGMPMANMCHGYPCAIAEYAKGKMDGFDLYPPSPGPGPTLNKYFAYTYVRKTIVQPYWTMAQRYVLADHMFPTEMGPSFTAHQDLIAATTRLSDTESLADVPSGAVPWSCNAPRGTTTGVINNKHVFFPTGGPRPCLDTYNTLADVLDAKSVSWKEYYPYYSDDPPASIWNAFAAIKKVFDGPDYANVLYKPHQILLDAQSGSLPGVAWVIPDFVNSDHTQSGSDKGPSWVAAIVNSIGNGPDWNSTAIVVVWDDWGGMYDHVPPPQLDYTGLGIRVPCLIVSPYARRGLVSHTRYEFGSIVKLIEKVFGTDSLGYTDVRANGMLDVFDFSQKPAPYRTIPAKYPTSFFLNQHASGLPVDDE